MLFGILLDKENEQDQTTIYYFFKKVNESLLQESLIKNPFRGQVKEFNNGFYIIDMQPIYVNISPIFFIIAFGAWLFHYTGVMYFMLACGLITAFLFSKYFAYCGLYLGLRKAGYNQSIKLLSGSESIRRLLSQ